MIGSVGRVSQFDAHDRFLGENTVVRGENLTNRLRGRGQEPASLSVSTLFEPGSRANPEPWWTRKSYVDVGSVGHSGG